MTNTHSARAAIAHSAEQPFELAEVELEAPRADEVIVRVVSAGICHTDLSAKAGLLGLPMPIVLGH